MGNQSYQHDAAGNLSDDSLNSYHYNGRNRLVEVKRQGLNVVYYAYNAWGERVSKAVAGQITHFLYDEAGRLLGTYQQTPQGLTPQQELVWLEDTPVAVLVPGATGVQVYRIQPDHLDTPRLVQDSSGKTVWTWPQAEPFGANPPNEDPDGDGVRFTLNLRFPGQHFDAETGLHYNYFRDYAPTLGRYVESDPIGLDGGVNTYGYVDGEPLDQYDSEGLKRRKKGGGPTRGDARGYAKEQKEQKDNGSGCCGAEAHVFAVCVDIVTGRKAYGFSQGLARCGCKAPPALAKRFPNPSREPWPTGNCAEDHAAAKLVMSGSNPDNIRCYAVDRAGNTKPPCKNCRWTYRMGRRGR